ncbi:MAG: sulfotransferase, partial [Verrucomicrobiota bacterium]|nr:sulfotransferase [Verrucomicrobiota bacterium]
MSARSDSASVEFSAHRPPAAFIVGVPRSGTTLLRMMLDSHPEMAIPPETHFYYEVLKLAEHGAATRADFFTLLTGFFSWADFGIEPEIFREALSALEPFAIADGLRAFHMLYAQRFGKRRWGEKTPDYGNVMREIAGLLPEARFIHLIRDGRDVALSRRNLWFGPGESVLAQAEDWAAWIRRARSAGPACPHYLEVQYERLVAEPAQVLREVCDFLELPFRAEMLLYHQTAEDRLQALQGWPEQELTGEKLQSILRLTTQPPQTDRGGRWKREMAADEAQLFEEIAGPLLQELGYEVGAATRAAERPRKMPARQSVSALLLTDGITEEAMPWFRRVREQVDEFVVWIDQEKAAPETEERARRLGASVAHFAADGFADPHVTRAVAECRTDWILRLDSDEELSAEWDHGNWRELLDLPYASFAMPRRWITQPGKYLSAAPWFPDHQVRLFQNKPEKMRSPDVVHGTIAPEGRRGYCATLA